MGGGGLTPSKEIFFLFLKVTFIFYRYIANTHVIVSWGQVRLQTAVEAGQRALSWALRAPAQVAVHNGVK